MTFPEALKQLGIEEYQDAIFNSNSHGELFHLHDYFELTKVIQKPEEVAYFKEWFKYIVDFAKNNWKRPESIYQHILKIFKEHHYGINTKP